MRANSATESQPPLTSPRPLWACISHLVWRTFSCFHFHHQRQPPFVIYQRASTVSHLSPSQITGHISQIILRHRFLPCYFFVCRCLYDYWIKPRLLWGIQSIYGLSKCVSTNSNNIYHSSFLGSKERSPLSFICKATFAQGISRAYTRQPRKVVQVVHCTTSKGDIYI